jgi:hypothetical protein
VIEDQEETGPVWPDLLHDESKEELVERIVNMVLDTRSIAESARDRFAVKLAENLIEKWTDAMYLANIPIPNKTREEEDALRIWKEQDATIDRLMIERTTLTIECERLKILLRHAKSESA